MGSRLDDVPLMKGQADLVFFSSAITRFYLMVAPEAKTAGAKVSFMSGEP